MHPWLIWTESFRVPTYLTCIIVGAMVGVFVLARELRHSSLPRRVVYDIAFLALPAGFVGARLFMILEAPMLYISEPWRLLVSGGWVFQGAMIGAGLALMTAARFRGLDPWDVADVFTPALPMGLAFGRLGCLGAGCCHGRPADWPLGITVPWSVRYYRPTHVPEGLLAVDLHPSPLYAAGLGLAVFVLTIRVARRRQFSGQVLLTMLMGYSAGRFVLEWFRGDLERGFHLGGMLSTAQLTSLVTLAIAAAYYWSRRRACIPS